MCYIVWTNGKSTSACKMTAGHLQLVGQWSRQLLIFIWFFPFLFLDPTETGSSADEISWAAEKMIDFVRRTKCTVYSAVLLHARNKYAVTAWRVTTAHRHLSGTMKNLWNRCPYSNVLEQLIETYTWAVCCLLFYIFIAVDTVATWLLQC